MRCNRFQFHSNVGNCSVFASNYYKIQWKTSNDAMIYIYIPCNNCLSCIVCISVRGRISRHDFLFAFVWRHFVYMLCCVFFPILNYVEVCDVVVYRLRSLLFELCIYCLHILRAHFYVSAIPTRQTQKESDKSRTQFEKNENKQRNKKTNAQQTKLKQQLNRRRLLTGYSLIRAMKYVCFFFVAESERIKWNWY